jgi:ABC-type sugar transport system ATPase subunit
MNNLINLPAGIYKPKDRDFVFSLTSSLIINSSQGRSLLLLKGDNGAGKTTFLEKIIIPALTKNQILFRFFAQDDHLQQITSRCLETIFQLSQSGRKLLSQIFFNTEPTDDLKAVKLPETPVILLDESDKLLTDQQIADLLQNNQYQLVIMISHHLDSIERQKNSLAFDQIMMLNFFDNARQRIVELSK